jgi:RHS repeat-associated protein
MAQTYDVENRLLTAVGEQYGYTPDNKRVWRKMPSGTETVTFWLGNRALARYTVGSSALTLDTEWRHFGGRNLSVLTDRVGSNLASGKRYFPYGEEVPVSNNDDFKFGTYWRDLTGLDYADQRYYASAVGRFLTADPYAASAGAEDPGSWNRYGYVEGDPLNFNDAQGLFMSAATAPPSTPQPPAQVDLTVMCLALAQNTYLSSQNPFSGAWQQHNWGSAGYYSWQSACQHIQVSAPPSISNPGPGGGTGSSSFDPKKLLIDCLNDSYAAFDKKWNPWIEQNPIPTLPTPTTKDLVMTAASYVVSNKAGSTPLSAAIQAGIVLSLSQLWDMSSYAKQLYKWGLAFKATGKPIWDQKLKAFDDCNEKWGPVAYPAYYQHP